MKFPIFDYQAPAKVEKRKIFFDFQFSKRGFTFIDVMVGTALVLVIFLGIFNAYQLGMKVVGQSKNKITATALANEQIEKIRNLPYESVGIIDGQLPVAVGVLASSTNIFLNNVEYFIKRNIEYISDEADGIGDEDECDLDYKRAEIEVSWGGRFSGEVKMVTDIAPKNKFEEIASCQAQPGGILSVKVFDAFGLMIASPLIEVFNTESGELIASYTPVSGKKDIPLATSTYKVVVSKTGYSTDRTYGTDEITTPTKPHPIILEKQTTEISFSIDKISAFSVNTFFPEKGDEEPIPIADVEFDLRGEKLIGYDVEDKPVYKYSQAHTSDGQGQIDISGLEWDNYIFSVAPETGLYLVEIKPEPDPESGAIGLAPDTTLPVNLYLESENSFLIFVKDDETLEPIFSAMVRLYNVDLAYDNALYTDEKGRSLFIPLESATYNLEIGAPGYLGYQGQISILGHTKKTEELARVE